MEHNAKTVLTQKMREVEGQPVSWNKEDVWLKVEHRVSSNSSNRRIHKFYCYAAAVTFLVLFSITTSHEPETLQADSVVKVADETESVQPVKANESAIIQSFDLETASKQPVPIPEKHQANTTNHLAAANEINEAIKPEVTMPKEEPQLVRVAADERITPIIGVVIIPEQQQTITKTKRKKLFRKLDSFEQEFDDSFRSIVIARNK